MSVSKAIGRHVPFADLLGITVAHHEPGKARLELPLRPELANSWGVAHGGVVMTLADVALGVAAITRVEGGRGAATIELKVSFIRPGTGRLLAEGRCLEAGRSLAFCEGEVTDTEGKLVAKALGTFRVRRGEDSPGDAIEPGEGRPVTR
jgi:uncharacterized protein (TIGR00369 family)